MAKVGSKMTLASIGPPPALHSLVPDTWATTVRQIGMAECREAALSLAHAFAADGLSLYMVTPDFKSGKTTTSMSAEAMWRLHVDIMTYFVGAVAMNGMVTTIGPDYEGVALWLPPGRDLDSWWTALRSGLWRLRLQLPAACRRRYYAELLPLLHATKQEVMGGQGGVDDSYYLLYLGTKPAARRRGHGQKLLEHMLSRVSCLLIFPPPFFLFFSFSPTDDQADAESRRVYLESSSAANNAYYSKFGFALKKDIVLVCGPQPVALSIMVRDPVSRKVDDL